MNRRTFFRKGLAGGAVTGASVAAGEQLAKTPSQTAGPFYPVVVQKDKDFDLTKIEGADGVAEGEVIDVVGSVRDTDGNPIEDASVDIWQANAAGRYRHPHDRNPAPLDPNFQGWAIVPSGVDGKFKFRTIVPGSYPASKDWSRPPHIHFKVTKKGYKELTTQMYFPGHELNEKDRILQSETPEERQLLVSKKIRQDPPAYEFDVVLAKA